MNNRYRIRDHIKTDGVLLVDDDIILHESLFECLIETWLLHKKQVMVGPGPRTGPGARQ